MPKKKNRLSKHTALDGTKYQGTLATPISLLHPNSQIDLLTTAAESAAIESKFQRELFQKRQDKFEALFKLYAVDSKGMFAWAHLAWQLACAHVPGLQLAKESGAPRRPRSDFAICDEIFQYRKKKPGKTITAACRALTRQGRPLHGIKATTARRIYAANLPWRRILASNDEWAELNRVAEQSGRSPIGVYLDREKDARK